MSTFHVAIGLSLIVRLVPGKLERRQADGTLDSDAVQTIKSVI